MAQEARQSLSRGGKRCVLHTLSVLRIRRLPGYERKAWDEGVVTLQRVPDRVWCFQNPPFLEREVEVRLARNRPNPVSSFLSPLLSELHPAPLHEVRVRIELRGSLFETL